LGLSFRKLLFTLVLAIPALAQTNRSGCALLNLDEVTAALGPGTTSRDTGGICIFTSKTTTVTATLAANAIVPFQTMKITANQNGGVVKDETTLGVPAYSVVGKDGRGFSIFMLKGTWGAAIGADTGGAKVPDLVRDKVRALAKKAATRM
jgi:hypothetical protein